VTGLRGARNSTATAFDTRRRMLSMGLLAGCTGAWAQSKPSQSSAAVAPLNRAEIEVARANERQQLCSAVNKSGVGLRGQYFLAKRCEGQPLVTRIDGPIELMDRSDWPADRIRSVRWQGWVRPPLPGKYLFHVEGKGVEVMVARQRAVDPLTALQQPIEFVAGRYYPIEIRIDALASASVPLRLSWTAPHGLKFLVPRASMYPPTV
jgi:PA14 domain